MAETALLSDTVLHSCCHIFSRLSIASIVYAHNVCDGNEKAHFGSDVDENSSQEDKEPPQDVSRSLDTSCSSIESIEEEPVMNTASIVSMEKSYAPLLTTSQVIISHYPHFVLNALHP